MCKEVCIVSWLVWNQYLTISTDRQSSVHPVGSARHSPQLSHFVSKTSATRRQYTSFSAKAVWDVSVIWALLKGDQNESWSRRRPPPDNIKAFGGLIYDYINKKKKRVRRSYYWAMTASFSSYLSIMLLNRQLHVFRI